MIANFVPKKCLICGSVAVKNELFCEECIKFAPKLSRPCKKCGSYNFSINQLEICSFCNDKKFYFDDIFSFYIYSGAVSKLITTMKYGKDYSKALSIGNFMAKNLPDKFKKSDYVVFPPMSFFSKIIRGFNQAEIMADRISFEIYAKFDSNIIKKVKKTKKQAELSFKERLKNLNNAFKLGIDLSKIKGKSFLFVDDVATTLATANEIAKLLKQNEAKEVFVLTFARTSPFFKN
jgi:ComF family protein